MTDLKADETRTVVREHYARIAKGCCNPGGVGTALDDVRAMLAAAGFTDIAVTISPRSAEIVSSWLPGIEKFVASATIEARKPIASGCCA